VGDLKVSEEYVVTGHEEEIVLLSNGGVITMKATVIFDTCREGSLNMALDSLLLQQLREEEQVFLRFYTWCPATVSIGLFQKWQQQQHSPYPVVRRPTGGKAVLHLLDVSYSFGWTS